MHLIDPQGHTRRAFLRRSGQLAMAGTALPFALNLASVADAAAQTADSDYKALVCVYLYGGSDYANTVITYDDPSYNAYSMIRGGGAGQGAGGIAIGKAALEATRLDPTTPLPEGRQYALHPSMTSLARLFNKGQVGVLLNAGPLVEPITRAQFVAGSRRVPPKLLSHIDQQAVWQASSPQGSKVGWGGNMGELALAQNTGALFTCISVTGNTVFLSGDTAAHYQIGTNGAIAISAMKYVPFGSSSVKAAMAQLVQQASGHALENEYSRVTRRSVAAEGTATSAIGAPHASGAFPAGNSLASQLAMVARLIRGRSVLGVKRQVFMVGMGGFDLHDNLVARQAGLLGSLSDAMSAFHEEMVAQGLADQVTQFTASDFGRTLTSNGDGSDHGWGGHHFIVGGTVKGKQRIYGHAPVVNISNLPNHEGYEGHIGQGRLIPTTSVDQYAATLARWFGVSAANLADVVPNLRTYGGTANGLAYPRDLGFMA
ncbi:DUF1501 domain-containing protein [Variovorax sp. J22R133]|uniref:DUF1501 domain-containing protein n=1 Tax=Variovorax brevis TaxID=3053503 RepID=UPI00257894E6|nr:DUF1501 domain-containing protein [Variovorax sp. J22R133]MDM0115376.1 DUF1501 domain-containing protein [Variovorax sp. J22R133]